MFFTTGAVNKDIKSKRKFSRSHFYNILRLFDILPIFFSPQVKRFPIITYKYGIYEFPHALPNDLKLRILENSEISRKC